MKTTFLLIFIFNISSLVHLLCAQNPTKDDSLLTLLSQTNSDIKKIELLLALSETGAVQEAVRYASEALDVSEKSKQQYWIARSYWQLAKAYEKQKNYTQAELYFSQAEYISNAFPKKEQAKLYMEYGRVLVHQGKYKDAEKKYPKALHISQELGDEKMQAKAMYALAVAWYRTGNYDKAEPLFEKTHLLFLKLSQNTSGADCLTGIGACREKKGEYDKALEYYLKAARIKEAYNKPEDAYSEYLSIGNIYNFYLFSPNEALHYYQKTYEIGLKTQNKRIQTQALNNLGLVYEKKNNLEKAIEMYQLALKYNKEIGYLYGENYNYRNLANAYTKLNKHKEALEFRKEAKILLEEKIGDKSLIATNLRQSAINLIALERFDEAEENLTKSLAIVTDIKEYKELPQIYEDFATLEEARKNFPKALYYLKAANQVSDSIFTLQKNEQIAKLKVIYETEKKEQENLLLMKENQLQKSELEAKSLLQKQILLSAEKAEQENKALLFANKLQEEAIKQKDLLQKITLSEKEKQYQEAHRLKKENELQEKVLLQSKLIIVIISIAGAFLAILAYLFFRQKVKEVKAKQEIAEKNEELKQQNEEILAQANQIEQQSKDIEARNAKIEMLLREIHHRVKNNMQTISSLLNLQSAQIQDEKAKEAIREGRNRVKAMTIIHQKLYQQEDISQVNLQEYIEKLCQDLMHSYGYRLDEVEQYLTLEEVSLDIDQSIPLCLIINELITNFYKYVAPNNLKPRLWINLSQKDNHICIKIKDNGKGIEDLEKVQMGKVQSFGWKLINSLVRQLNADLQIENNNGLDVKILLPAT